MGFGRLRLELGGSAGVLREDFQRRCETPDVVAPSNAELFIVRAEIFTLEVLHWATVSRTAAHQAFQLWSAWI